MRLRGRDTETARIDRLLDGAGGVLIIRGEAGIGKSSLLEYASRRARGMRILRGEGIESEAELAYAGLHLLLHPYTGRLGAIPPLQASALRGALGLDGAPAGDRFLVGLAVLSLLAELTEDGPLLCLIDDVQWIDQASVDALAFAARRLQAEPITLLLAARDDGRLPDLPGVPELRPRQLDAAEAGALLADNAVPPPVRDRVVAEAQGNPLALLELATAVERDDRLRFGVGALPASGRVRRSFDRQIRALPERARTLLLLASADSTGDVALVLEAGRRFGVTLTDLDAAEGLVSLAGGRLSFRHPLVRSAAYQVAPPSLRLEAHRALADALDDDPERRAWHLAAATTAPDEEVAAALERGAEHARSRGGHAAVAAAYERAAEVSADRSRRGRRLAAAAAAAGDAGHALAAGSLADRAAPLVTDPLALAGLAQVRAAAAYKAGRLKAANRMLADSAVSVSGTAPDRAAFMFLEAMTAAWDAGDAALVRSTVARLSETCLPRGHFVVRGTRGLAHMFACAPQKGVPALRDLASGARGRTLGVWERASIENWDFLTGDFDTAYDTAAALERDCRTQGAIGVLPRVLLRLARAQVLTGLFRDARASAEEGLRIARDTSQPHYTAMLTGVLGYLAAVEGDEKRCRALVEEMPAVGTIPCTAWAGCALALLDLGLGRYERALRRLERIPDAAGRYTPIVLVSLPDQVEAAVRHGEPRRAAAALERFSAWSDEVGRPWARAVTLRCRAQLSPDPDPLYAEAISLHEEGGRPFERARTELLYGEWLRRDRRRADARGPLRSAANIFHRLGATPWTERARGELRATGESLAREEPGPDVLRELTTQELQVVRLAATGMTNRDIAGQLFLSPRTVGYHLHKAYPKLGIASRNELARLVGDDAPSRSDVVVGP